MATDGDDGGGASSEGEEGVVVGGFEQRYKGWMKLTLSTQFSYDIYAEWCGER